jgi:hypothetical protein
MRRRRLSGILAAPRACAGDDIDVNPGIYRHGGER